MSPNVDLLRRTLAHIEAHPERHDQTTWARNTTCGTTMCFAGWALSLSSLGGRPYFGYGFSRTAQWVFPDGTTDYIEDLAGKVLGLDQWSAAGLFYAMDLDGLREEVDALIVMAEIEAEAVSES